MPCGPAVTRALAAILALLLTGGLLLVPTAASAQAASSDPAAASLPGVSAPGAVVWDPADDRVLWERDADVARPMASTTKMMTALLVVEAGALDDTVVVSPRAAAIGRVPGGATLGLREGERLAMRDVLAGLLLRSGNDAAVAVAEHVAGSEAAFVELMNARADQLGLHDTAFVNASGLTDDPAHHATPLDLARLGEVVLAEPVLADLVGAAVVDTAAFGRLENRNTLIGSYDGAVGIKTGYTALAGRCLVAAAERSGRQVITVVLGADDHLGDSAALLDHAYSGWRRVHADATGLAWRTSGGRSQVEPADPVAATIARDAEVGQRVTWTATLDAGAGGVVGRLDLLADGEVADTAALTAGDLPPTAVGAPAALQDALRQVARAGLQVRPEQAQAGTTVTSSPLEPRAGSQSG